MPRLAKKLVPPPKRRAARHEQASAGSPAKLDWDGMPMELPFEPKHLTREQIREAVDKLPA